MPSEWQWYHLLEVKTPLFGRGSLQHLLSLLHLKSAIWCLTVCTMLILGRWPVLSRFIVLLYGPESSAETREGVSQRAAVDGWAGQVSVPFPWHIKYSMCWAMSSARWCYSHPCPQFSCLDDKFSLNPSCCNIPSFLSMAGSQICMCLHLNTN